MEISRSYMSIHCPLFSRLAHLARLASFKSLNNYVIQMTDGHRDLLITLLMVRRTKNAVSRMVKN